MFSHGSSKSRLVNGALLVIIGLAFLANVPVDVWNEVKSLSETMSNTHSSALPDIPLLVQGILMFGVGPGLILIGALLVRRAFRAMDQPSIQTDESSQEKPVSASD